MFKELSLLGSTGQKCKQIEKLKQFFNSTAFDRSITALPTSDLPPPNLPGNNGNDEDEDGEPPVPPGNSGNQRRCQRPQYQTVAARLATFRDWPLGSSQSPEHLAEAGFYYTGYSDEVRCFHCGISLKMWSPGDKAWVEHCRWSPNCSFAREVKGDQYIAQVQRSNESEQNNIFSTGPDENLQMFMRSIRQLMESILRNYQQITKKSNTLFEMNKRLKKRIFCCRCHKNAKKVMFLPCRHFLFCIPCAQNINKCPTCGKIIILKFTTYLP